MPQELYTKTGEKMEVKTDEEFATAQDEARQEGRTEGKKDAEADFTTQLDEKTTEVDTLKEDLAKAEKKETNFSKIREKSDKDKKEQEENKETIDDLKKQVDEGNTNLRNFVVGGVKSDSIKNLVGDDKELIKAMEENYDRIEGPEDNKEQIIAKVKESFGILQANEDIDLSSLDVEVNTGGKPVGSGETKFGGKKLSEEAKEMANRELGVTDKDLDTYLKP